MVNPVLVKTLQSIQQLLDETRELNNRYDPQRSAPSPQQRSRGLNIFRTSFEEFEVAARRGQKQKSVKNATRWAIRDADKFNVIVKRLKNFIDGLHDITRSLGVLSDSQARLKMEIESVSDRESLQLIRDAAGQEDVANVARQQLQQSYMASTVDLSRPAESITPITQNAQGIPSLVVRAKRRSGAGKVSTPTSTKPSSDDLLDSLYVDALSFELGAHKSKEPILSSTPDTFPKLFPSSETLFLQHDIESVDGNLALCVATATDRGCGPRVQLFYLIVEDIKRRKFSFRRYNRASGREVCFTSQVYRTKVRRRTRVRRSISNSMISIQSMSSGRRSSISSQASALGSSQSGAESTTHWSDQQNEYQRKTGAEQHPGSRLSHVCTCCPKSPKRYDTLGELRSHESKTLYRCQYCKNTFKSKNEAERHENSLHLRRHSWSCAMLANDYKCAFHSGTSTLHISTTPNPQLAAAADHKSAVDICGYCGKEFTDLPTPNWEHRITHLNIHRFGECNQSKKFFRVDHFRQHLKHTHGATSGTWTSQLEVACMNTEAPTAPIASVTDHDGMGLQHNGEQGMPSSQRNSSPVPATEQQQGEQGVPPQRRSSSPEPTNKINIVFSNYAVVEISRTGFAKNRKYEFEYWGTEYIWFRRKAGSHSGTAVSYSLCKSSFRDKILAHIKVQETDELNIRAEHSAGGWIPRALMRITDEEIINAKSKMDDLPDVFVATGVVAFVNDCIKKRWNKRKVTGLPPVSCLIDLGS